MEPEVLSTSPEEMISISKSEYERLCELAANPSFWIESLKNPTGTKGVQEFVQGIVQTGLTIYGDKILKKQLIDSTIRTVAVVLLLGAIVWIAMELTQSGKLDAGAFTFLIGTIVGYAFSYLTRTE
jgi:hypothetical protein